MTSALTPASSPAAAPAGTIVVGIDGSSGSDQALVWATEQARLEHRALTLVHSAHLGAGNDLMWMGAPGVDMVGLLQEIAASGRRMLADAERQVLRHAPDLDVHVVLSERDPRSALLELGERAEMLVLGSRGRGTVKTLLLGSVSVAVSKHALCPVVVVRHAEDAQRKGGVLVGVDGTEDSLPAIAFAFQTAALRSLPLTAMHVFWSVSHLSSDEAVIADDEPGLEDKRLLLSESLAGMREKYPEVEDRLVLAHGFRDQQLVRASADMDLVVVGSRHRGVVEDLLHGSVAPTVVENAACDVVVVPATPPS